MAKKKYIETPEKMWELFTSYREEVKNNPIFKTEQKKSNTILPKDLSKLKKEDVQKAFNPIIAIPIERPLTFEGFENWCADNGIIENLDNYFANSNDAYSEYSSICSRIRKVIRQDQIEGGMAGIYNPSITQRLNGLVDKSETKVNVEQPLFPD